MTSSKRKRWASGRTVSSGAGEGSAQEAAAGRPWPLRTALCGGGLLALCLALLSWLQLPSWVRAVEPHERPAATAPEQADGSGKPPADAAQILARTLNSWPQPRAVLVVTGRQHGYIEPCGCAGLTSQKGGLARRATLLRQLRERGWNVVPLDVGNQVRRFGRQPEIKFQTTVESLSRMGYRAVGWGPDDLRLTVGELVAATVNDEDLFVSSNVNLLDLVPAVRVVQVGDLKIGITAALGVGEQRKVNNESIEMSDPVEGLRQAAAKMRAESCSLFVLLAHADSEETQRLIQAVPEFDLVVTAGGAGEPTLRPEEIANSRSKVVQVGTKGMYAGAIGVFEGELRYVRVGLDGSFADDRGMLDSLATYQKQLELLGLEGLGLRPTQHPSGRTFVGSQVCGECHDGPFEIWQQTPHARATADLVYPAERSEVARHFDPECLSCHVTGWNPQGFYPYESGYLSLTASELLHGNGCENCHGPGSAHVAAEMGEVDLPIAERRQLRAQMRVALESAEQSCMACHDLDNSPDFHEPGAFERYWEEIRH